MEAVVLRVTLSQVAVEAVPATPQFFAALHILSKPAAAAGAALKRAMVALVVEAAVELPKTVYLELAAAAVAVAVPADQLEVRVEME